MLADKLMIDLMVLGVVKLMVRRLCRLVDGSMHHMVSTVNVQKTMPQQVSVVSTTKVTVHKILSLVSNAANSINKISVIINVYPIHSMIAVILCRKMIGYFEIFFF